MKTKLVAAALGLTGLAAIVAGCGGRETLPMATPIPAVAPTAVVEQAPAASPTPTPTYTPTPAPTRDIARAIEEKNYSGSPNNPEDEDFHFTTIAGGAGWLFYNEPFKVDEKCLEREVARFNHDNPREMRGRISGTSYTRRIAPILGIKVHPVYGPYSVLKGFEYYSGDKSKIIALGKHCEVSTQ